MATINPMELDGKRILVTGASSGIGRVAAKIISQLGAKVILLARNEERLQSTLHSLSGDGHSFYIFDLATIDDIPSILKKISKEQGPISGIFHSAGITAIWPVTLVREKYIEAVFGSSVKASLMLARGFIQKGVRGPGTASLVFMSSLAGLRGAKGLSIYSASKAGVDGAIRSLAVELAVKGIRVNSIAAAGIDSVMHREHLKNFTEEELLFYKQKHIMGYGHPEDVAYAAAFLLSDAAKWITGTTMIVDGGYCCV